MPEYLFIDYKTWGDIMDGLVSHLKRLKQKSGIYDFTHVYAPPRGGLPIAVHLSHHLDLIQIMDLDPYVGREIKPDHNILIIDDVVDTGKTYNEIRKVMELIIESLPTFQYKFASIHYKPRAIIKPDIYMQEVHNDVWVVYPFENCEECEKEKEDFRDRRQLNATQKMEKQDQIIWRSFLGTKDTILVNENDW